MLFLKGDEIIFFVSWKDLHGNWGLMSQEAMHGDPSKKKMEIC